MTVRAAAAEDVPWLLATAAEAYALEVPGFDRGGAERWIRACLVDPDTVVLRTGKRVATIEHQHQTPQAATP